MAMIESVQEYRHSLCSAINNGKYANILYPEPGLMASLAYRKTWTIEILSIIFKQTSIYSHNIHFRYFKKRDCSDTCSLFPIHNLNCLSKFCEVNIRRYDGLINQSRAMESVTSIISL